MAGNLVRVAEVATNTLGPFAFFRALRAETFLDRSAAKHYWSWEQWNRFFELAEEHGMTAIDQHQSGPKTVTNMHFKQVGHSLLTSWRAVRAAQDSGQSAYGFHITQEQQRAEDKRTMDEMIQHQAERMRKEREGASSSAPRRVSDF